MAFFEAKNKDFNFWSEQWAGAKMQVLQLSVLNGKDPLHGNRNMSTLSPSDRQVASEVASLSKATGAQKVQMLQRTIAYCKSRSETLTEYEGQAETRYEAEQAKHNQRLAVVEAEFKNGTLLAEFRDIKSKKENSEWARWQKLRSKEQTQLASLLKIQDGATKLSQALVDIYGKQGNGIGAPTVEQQKPMVDFCHQSFAEVMRFKDVLDNGDTDTVSPSPTPAPTAPNGKLPVQV